jgi:large subunit ribosomal protein L30
MALIKITQERSKIRCLDKHKRTLAALGLRRIRHSVVKNDTPQIRGMIASVSYLVRVEPATAGDAKPAKPAKPAKSAAPRTPRAKSTATAAKGGSK